MRQGNFSGVNPIFNPLSTRTDPNKPGGYLRDRFPNDVIPPSSMDPVGIKLINLYPQPLTSGLANNFTLSPPKRQTDDTFDVRVDHKIANADDFYARYSFNDTQTWIPGALPVDSKTGIDPVGDVSLGGPALQGAQSIPQVRSGHAAHRPAIDVVESGQRGKRTSTSSPGVALEA